MQYKTYKKLVFLCVISYTPKIPREMYMNPVADYSPYHYSLPHG